MNSMTEFDEYIRESEAHYGKKAKIWQTAIGLQEVDGLKPSSYLIETAKKHIEGDIAIDDVQKLIKSYYESKDSRKETSDGNEEADKVSANIAKLLCSDSFTFNTNGYLSVHRNIFNGVFKFAGQIRDCNITKKEWVLNGDTVNYMYAPDIKRALDYDIEQERNYNYYGLSSVEVVEHIAKFVANLWQIHAFREGNTRTTAVFTIQYLRSIGFDVTNDQFAEHSWYFRNALVRANYKNVKKGVNYDYTFINKFFRNLLLDEEHELKNRSMLINPPEDWKAAPQAPPQPTPQVSAEKTNIEKFKITSNLIEIAKAIANKQLTALQIMAEMGLKDRKNFKNTYLDPAISKKIVKMLYPDRPNHPRQKYYLTVKGLSILKQI